MHIGIDEDLDHQIDGVAGKRHRSQFVGDPVAAALEQRALAVGGENGTTTPWL